MKVWVVFSWYGNGHEDCTDVEGVFTDQNKANEIAKTINQAITVCPCNLDEHLQTINEEHSWPNSYYVYPDGTIIDEVS